MLEASKILSNVLVKKKSSGAAHYNVALVPAGLYFEMRAGFDFYWEMTIDGDYYRGEDIASFIALVNKVKKALKAVEVDGNVKKTLLLVYTWNLCHVSQKVNSSGMLGDHENDLIFNDVLMLRNITSIAPVASEEDLQSDFLKMEGEYKHCELYAAFAKTAIETMVLQPEQNGGAGKIFKTAASKAKWKIKQHIDNKDVHRQWMRAVTPYPDEYEVIRYEVFRAAVVMNHDSKHIYKNVVSYDQSSAHAHKALCKTFPISKPRHVSELEADYHDWHTLQGLEYYINKGWVWIKATFHVIDTREETDFLDPFKVGQHAKKHTTWLDKNQYEAFQLYYDYDDIEIEDLLFATEGSLPRWAKEAIAELYIDKASYKTKDAVRSMKKVVLNSGSYGCTVERVWDWWQDEANKVRASYSNAAWYKIWEDRILPPQIGVSITSYVMLDELRIIAKHARAFAYCDTDSIKGEHSDALDQTIVEHNAMVDAEIRALCEELNLDYELMQDLGKYQPDGKYNRFRAPAPKEYVYEMTDGKFGAHCAGYASHFPIKDEPNEELQKIWTALNDRYYNPELFEKPRVPVTLFEAIYHKQDPLEYFNRGTEFNDYVTFWDDKTCTYNRMYFKGTLYDMADFYDKHVRK